MLEKHWKHTGIQRSTHYFRPISRSTQQRCDTVKGDSFAACINHRPQHGGQRKAHGKPAHSGQHVEEGGGERVVLVGVQLQGDRYKQSSCHGLVRSGQQWRCHTIAQQQGGKDGQEACASAPHAATPHSADGGHNN